MRRLLALLPLPFVVLLATWGSARVADRAGGVMVGLFRTAAAFLVAPPAAPEDPDLVPTSGALAEEPAPEAASSAKKPARAKRPVAAKALFVSADTVMKIAATRVQLRGVPVAREGARPAGLRLVGVSALGVGLVDGDVLTKALGQPVLSRSEVVRAVLGARARQQKVLEGEFYRGSERWVLRVEQPYPPAPRALLESAGPGGVDSG